ncbi:MAG: aspartate-semialdehyde dehydrogenase [Candidatus Firestonebacteria bacterium]
MKQYNVAIVGATGAVGNKMREVLEERNFPVENLRLLASARSVGKKLSFKGEDISVEELKENSFVGIDIALFSAGATISRKFCPIAAKAGAIVVDNSSAWRMDKEVPLVVPEVNPDAIKRHKGIIANPNCSTIQMVVVLKPLHNVAKIKRIVVSTYQAVSGKGLKAVEELKLQSKALLEGAEPEIKVFPHRIGFNILPQIDDFLPNGYTKEEIKMIQETKKIMEDDSIKMTATTIRVPVFNCHSESVNIETEKKLSPDSAREILSKSPGVIVLDEPASCKYPLPSIADGKDECFVGRIREDESIENGLNLWIVADNIRKGAATNAVQIAEIVIKSLQ